MTFLNLQLLWIGLGCIAVPIIVHLLTRRRRKPVMWAAMRFLLEAYRKHKRRLQIEQLLLLAARCLLVALIAMALAKPVMGEAGMLARSGPRTLYLVVDNSLTAGAKDENGLSALDRHKASASELLSKLDQGRGDRVAVVALGSPAQPVVIPPSGDLGAVSRLVNQLSLTHSRADVAGAVGAIKAQIEGATDENGELDRTTIALLCDWRGGSAQVDRPLAAISSTAGTRPYVVAPEPGEAGIDNTAVVRVEPLRALLLAGDTPSVAGSTNQVRVSLARFGPGIAKAATTQLRVRSERPEAGGAGPVTTQTVNWKPGEEEAVVVVPVAPPGGGDSTASVVIVASIDRDSVEGDNTAFRPVEIRRAVQIGVLAPPAQTWTGGVDRLRPADWLRLSLQPEKLDAATSVSGEGLRLIDIDPRTAGQSGTLAGLDALLVPQPDAVDQAGWGKIGEFCRAGGFVMVSPGADLTVQLWSDAFLKAMGLSWSVGREAVAPGAGGEISAGGSSELLSLLAAELEQLARPVRVTKLLKVEPAAGSAETLLSLKDGSPLVIAGNPGGEGENGGVSGRGLVVLMAAAPDLSWTDLPARPLMLPLMQELIRQGVGRARGVWMGVAGGMPLLPGGATELRPAAITGVESSGEAISLAGASGVRAIRTSGVWKAVDSRGAAAGLVGVNADTTASRTTPATKAAVGAWLSGLAGEDRFGWLGGGSSGGGGEAGGSGVAQAALPNDPREPISIWVLFGAGAIAIVELVMARAFSHASTVESGVAR